jgi:hypothetical protein
MLNFATRSRIVFRTSSRGGGSPLIHRNGLMRATTNERRYGLTSPRSFTHQATPSLLDSVRRFRGRPLVLF